MTLTECYETKLPTTISV